MNEINQLRLLRIRKEITPLRATDPETMIFNIVEWYEN